MQRARARSFGCGVCQAKIEAQIGRNKEAGSGAKALGESDEPDFGLGGKHDDLIGQPVVPVHISLLFGATSAVCGALLGYPLTLIRTRLMAQGMPGRQVTTDPH